MFLNYLALFVLILGITLTIYVFFTIHDIPHRIAKKRHHPHEDAIGAACWLSLFTLHAIWPIVFIWSMMHKPGAESKSLSGDVNDRGGTLQIDSSTSLEEMRRMVQALNRRIDALEQSSGKKSDH